MDFGFELWILFVSMILSVSDAGFCQDGCRCMNENIDYPTVDCDGANLASISIVFNPRIRRLTLSNNRISTVTLDELSFYTELEYLDLSNNAIIQIERGAFYRLQKLKALRLNGNQLKQLVVETFAGLNELRALDLSGNQLHRLATSIFSDLRRLETLNVSKNSLTEISPGAFTGLTSLKEFHLQHNALTVVPKIALHAPQSLKILDLSFNRLNAIGDESFVNLKQLESLNLAGNGLHTIEERSFFGLRNLRQLYLDTNSLHRVPTISFRPLTELDTLSLSENLVDELTTSAFEGLARLRQLTVSRCPQLKSVSVNAFSGLFALEVLILSENRALSSVDPMAFELLHRSRVNQAKLQTSLRQLYIFGNNFTSLPSALLPWRQLDELDLRSNPWTCDCEFASWIGRALRNVYWKRGSYPDGAVCDQPTALKGRHLHLIRGYSDDPDDRDFQWTGSEDDLMDLGHCRSTWSAITTDLLITIPPVLVCLFASTVVVWICIRYRRRICNRYSYFCCSNAGQSPLKFKPPPPGLPELFRYGPTANNRGQDFYSGSCMIAGELEGLYMEDEENTDYARKYASNGFERVSYEHPNQQRPSTYGGTYHRVSAEETRTFLPPITRSALKKPKNLYTNTSDYYSGLSSNASHSPPESTSSSQISPSTHPNLKREESFRIIQRYPIPITEL